jgi:hypothetical protein
MAICKLSLDTTLAKHNSVDSEVLCPPCHKPGLPGQSNLYIKNHVVGLFYFKKEI